MRSLFVLNDFCVWLQFFRFINEIAKSADLTKLPMKFVKHFLNLRLIEKKKVPTSMKQLDGLLSIQVSLAIDVRICLKPNKSRRR